MICVLVEAERSIKNVAVKKSNGSGFLLIDIELYKEKLDSVEEKIEEIRVSL